MDCTDCGGTKIIRSRDRGLVRQLDGSLNKFHNATRNLPGIQLPARRVTFLAQVIESVRRVKYVSVIRDRDINECRMDPNSQLFDPLKAAILFQRQGELDEAFWMVFFFVHFGKHPRSGWRYARQVYGRLGDLNNKWDWTNTSSDPSAFRQWLYTHEDQIRVPGMKGGFGNHRKYQSLDAYSNPGTGSAFATYIQWVGPPRSHVELIDQAVQRNNQNPRKTFRDLYQSMKSIASFGRTARFDFLTMIGKLGLAKIEPDSTYMQGSTGPLSGARMLFGNQQHASTLDLWLIELESEMGVGMQVLEDALCNWQKNPEIFIPFRG